ncbi:NUDIX-domain-containing protein [Pseudovirgaria hyperparasitica]|uniref:NUDIX-domain-containing protein n=1 Tax=Pseudovirgaria hyperparasitica TaxID=470096 RepID=A0A6A6VV21_9PEZI|nr:NUDIX-domain-containing protein [Pseudovirgaria hyperparasitica]KAF2754412.1 NUDIX-domain-containing protein [Pseudovirgaria hyperparasitica]
MTSLCSDPTTGVTHHLQNALLDLATNPYPNVPSPPETKKRASVAVILRIQPTYAYWPENTPEYRRHKEADSLPGRLNSFFSQNWTQHGDPEVLFIRRAARQGDRWTSHVALPGGKRDPEDKDDHAAAVREAWEEVGIDLSDTQAISAGNLPQRVVTTSFGKVPLMVLCPYVFLLTSDKAPSLRLQPTEVASAHWVPLRALLSSKQRTYEYQDVSNRLAKNEVGIKRSFFRLMLGRMLFAAIHLIPSQSQYCSSIEEFIPTESTRESEIRGPKRDLATILRGGVKPYTSSPSEKPLLLWGLTLGVMADFLELLPPHTALELWTYPTFTPWDVRLTLWVMSWRFRSQKKEELATDGLGPDALVSDSNVLNNVQSSPLESYAYPYRKPAECGIGGLGAGTYYDKIRKCQVSRQGAISILLEGYYEIVRKAVAIALIGRFSTATLAAYLIWYKFRRK